MSVKKEDGKLKAEVRKEARQSEMEKWVSNRQKRKDNSLWWLDSGRLRQQNTGGDNKDETQENEKR